MRSADEMQRSLSQRECVLLGLFHVISLLVVASTSTAAAAVDGGRRWDGRLRRSGTADGGDQNNSKDDAESCRCAAEQWEGVLRSFDRAFYVAGHEDEDQPSHPHLRTAEMKSHTAIHYDFRNSLFASQDFGTGIKTVIDYNRVILIVIILILLLLLLLL